jgi:hypothetical protein
MTMNSFDIDGVICMGYGECGVRPHYDDIIITGRSHEESEETKLMLRDFGIHNEIFFNPINFDAKTRYTSGIHKANTLNMFKGRINIHFEDDPVQIKVIKEKCPWIKVVFLDHDLTERENIRHVHEVSKSNKA